ncbi:MAG: ArsR family transcriptional regulator [Nitrosopumilaceae archaeon]|nr:ArsR family transcriptional regulator [Nitrosopumilaceae archaeon]NIU00590.1 ArsR family transcriptional regulator [Nitrosopumilaceae archaeon]NIU86976.1 ArsR family transcriptional regulator [Nitrosopumilaceae archaeon]NIV66440.1 ArsR family transcriptional regulator [Nitrosopumilaceae archaeon]NIX61192.1 ArsR family transcriptional regulator [Nitrosopumilaceae archaeon]
MDFNLQESAEEFLELASEQRLSILNILSDKKARLTEIAKTLDSTKPEIHRNLQRLENSEIITKDVDGFYFLTTYGLSLCTLMPSITFISKNKQYFRNHNFGSLPLKFIHRVGELSNGKMITGFSRTLDHWKQIFENSQKFIYGILVEEPSSLIEPLIKKGKKGIKINSLFSESAIVPETRKQVIKKLSIQKLITSGILQRRMKKDLNVMVILNEQEACVSFPNSSGETDISKMFYGSNFEFHEWCLDFFRYCWHNSRTFDENKLLKQ